MTMEEIETKQKNEMVKFELAKKIRKMLDEASEKWDGDDDWSDVEAEIGELIFGE